MVLIDIRFVFVKTERARNSEDTNHFNAFLSVFNIYNNNYNTICASNFHVFSIFNNIVHSIISIILLSECLIPHFTTFLHVIICSAEHYDLP